MSTLVRIPAQAVSGLLGIVLLLGSAAAMANDERRYSAAQLDQLLAPIALYPDTVLSHVLIASTYPLEVVRAARWARQHRGLRGAAAVQAAEHEGWDPSVTALTAFPDLLARLDEDLNWTEQLGDAFLLQEGQVSDSVQRLRDQAWNAGSLRSGEHLRVTREPGAIIIEPVRPLYVHLPFYDTRRVYGIWHWAGFAPVWWACPSGYYPGNGFWWGPGYTLAGGFYFASFNWHLGRILYLNHHQHRLHRVHRPSRQITGHRHARQWRHDPTHRRAHYRDRRLAQHYGGAHNRHHRRNEPAYRGHNNHRRPGHRPGNNSRRPGPARDEHQRSPAQAGPGYHRSNREPSATGPAQRNGRDQRGGRTDQRNDPRRDRGHHNNQANNGSATRPDHRPSGHDRSRDRDAGSTPGYHRGAPQPASRDRQAPPPAEQAQAPREASNPRAERRNPQHQQRRPDRFADESQRSRGARGRRNTEARQHSRDPRRQRN